MKYDILIPAHEKDFSKLRFVYDSILKNLKGFDKFYCISNIKIPEALRISNVNYFTDDEVLDFDFSILKMQKRVGWYRQQFIKHFQQVTGDNYLITESDNIYLKPVDIIEDGKPTFLLGKDQNHAPYYQITQKLFGFGREYPYSFINEVMYIKRDYINELVALTPYNKYGYFNLIMTEINRMDEASGMSDYDLYGNFVAKYHPNEYNYKKVETVVLSKHKEWTPEEIQQRIDLLSRSNNVMVKLHTWLS